MPVHRRMGTDVQPLPAAGLTGTGRVPGPNSPGAARSRRPETIWDSPKTLAASRSVAARVRVETVKSTGCVIRALEEYDLVFNTARIGGV